MKNLLILLLTMVIISSCKKVACDCELPVVLKLGFDSGCIVRTYSPLTKYLITDSIRLIVANLFQKNGIDTNMYKGYSLYSYILKSTTPPYLDVNHKQVGFYKYYNGYRIFENDLLLHFNNDVLDSFSKNIVQPIKYKVFDTESTLQLGQLRYLFMRDINLYQHLGNHFNDSCTRAELCYYLPFYDSSILYKSWLVSPLNSPKPNSIYYDSTGGLATYNDL